MTVYNRNIKRPVFWQWAMTMAFVGCLATSCEYGLEYSPDESLSADFSEQDLRFEGKKIVLTRHARCRMDCRKIDAYEIQEVINQGHITARKSKSTAPPGKCPTTAYEGTTRDNQLVRVILGTCETPKIITVIDLKNDYKCTCK